jgi:hypothetical protein
MNRKFSKPINLILPTRFHFVRLKKIDVIAGIGIKRRNISRAGRIIMSMVFLSVSIFSMLQ